MKTSCVAKSGYFIRHRLEVRTLCKLSGPFHRPSDCTMGRGKQHGGRQVVPINVGHTHVPHEERTCPLCIELLDATEKQFLPCPCGYQVCLFCFERIKRDCSNLCPGCRTEYGSEKDPFQKGEAQQRDACTSSNSGATPQKARAANSQRSSPMPSPTTRQTTRSQRGGAQSGGQSTSPVNHAPEPSGHPSHTQSTQGHQAQSAARPNDAWERTQSAAESSVAEQDQVLGQISPGRQTEDVTESAGPHSILGHETMSDNAMASAGVSGQGSGSRFRWPSASETLQSAAMRVGWGSWRFQKRRPDAPTSDPEGAALTLATQRAVQEGRVSSSQGAAQLISFLQRREAHQGLAAAQGSYQGNEVEHDGRPAAAQSWPRTMQPGAPSAPPTEQRHGNGGATQQDSSAWAVSGGAQNAGHADIASRFPGLFAAPAEQQSGSTGVRGGPAYSAYQNGF